MFNFLKHAPDGTERPDTRPLMVRLGFRKPLTLAEQIARFTQSPDWSEAMKARNIDTFDEADDFDIGDPEPDGINTPYEAAFDKIAPQTRLDEIRNGMVEDMPFERKTRAQERLNPKKTESEKAPEPK